MSFDELELEAIIQEVLEECGEFENLDDEELYELIEKIKEFNRIVCKFECDFDLEQGRYYIDAKSMLGILSLDLSAVLQRHFTTSEDEAASILDAIKDFIEE